MAIYFVDPASGDDANNGRSADEPLRTLRAAADRLRRGDVLRLHAGSIFRAPAAFPADLAGTPAEPIVVEPYAGPTATFDARLVAPPIDVVPNLEWERVAGGHPEEWRSRQVLELPGSPTAARVRYGAFVDSRLRLITYSRIEDLRATNESFVAVALDDPRDAGGPLVDDPRRKKPWTYLGPGLIWVFENPADDNDRRGRVHVRLSQTHLRALGTRDYAGPSDPNQVRLALSAEGSVALTVGASNVVLRNLTIANGGTTTLTVTGAARNVTFEHCTVLGGRFGVRISGDADRVAFRHCTFDGGLAPWTVRADVKSSYEYTDPAGHNVPNGLGKETHDILVLSPAASNVEFDHCTFRRAHDALQLGGTSPAVHHCLFEDLNDEVVQFFAPVDAHIFKNLFRQVLHPFSFALEEGGGPIFIYRNVIDQRLPTRGFRVLPPDAPAPHIFRYGASYKGGHPMPDVHVYQNTFVGADRDDKASALSLLFHRSDLAPDAHRVHLNNLIVGLDLDLPYTWATTPSARRRSDGNLWHAPQRADAAVALFQRPDGSIEHVRTIAQLRELGWEVNSTFAEPGLVNFDDENFEHGRYLGDDFPHNDWRPAPGSPARTAGVPLPAELVDPDRPAGDVRPDIGAMVFGGPALRVGVDDAVILPTPATPVARAGPDQLITDTDGDGYVTVTVDGTRSTTPTGTLTRHTWTSNGSTLATQPVATLTLPEGRHYLRLAVTNSLGRTDTDGARVEVRPPQPHGDNLVRNGGFEDGSSGWQLARATIVTGPVHSGRRAVRIDAGGVIAQRLAVTPATSYHISAWVRRPTFLPTPIRVGAVFFDAAGRRIANRELTFGATTNYTYRPGQVVAPAEAVAMDLSIRGDTGGMHVFVDDVRVVDDNLLANAGFEVRAPTGRDDAAPHWRFEAGGARVVTAPEPVRSGNRAVALEGIPTDFRQVTQEIRTLTGAARYRITAWLRTDRISAAPTVTARFDAGSDHIVANETSDGAFRLIGRELAAPPGAERLTLQLRLAKDVSGTAYLDDLLVIPVA